MIERSASPRTKYKEQSKIHLFQIETFQNNHSFLPDNHHEIIDAIHKKTPLEKILKHVYGKFEDDGLLHTLVHRVY